ncbi:MAG: CocE/NonD family hydrolase [Steroidobacteraceae bacterium]
MRIVTVADCMGVGTRAVPLLAVLLLAVASSAWRAGAAAAAAADAPAATRALEAKVSRFGEYRGYSRARFSEWVRESQYITVRDGTRLAADIVRPSVNGAAVAEKLPVVWTHARYHRNPHNRSRYFAKQVTVAEGETAPGEDAFPPGIMSVVDESPMLQNLMRHGYVIASVAVRGSDASFGRYQGTFGEAETNDAYDVIEWLSKQRWSDGNIGMFGASYLGITQYMAASTHHPALKAIMPEVALVDLYDVLYPGGIYRQDFMERWGELTRTLDQQVRPLPVDGDRDEQLLGQALREHQGNWDPSREFRAAPLRDHDSQSFAWQRFGPSAVLDRIRSGSAASYHWGGFYDAFARDEFVWLKEFNGPQKLGMGPWPHSGYTPAADSERTRISTTEHHRWFDFWLKGIRNGVMDGPAVNYAITDVPGESWQWESARTWPPENSRLTVRYFAAGRSGSVSSQNDGLLARDVPPATHADEYAVRLDTSTGMNTRWRNTVSFSHTMSYPDMTANDLKSLTYTTPALESDTRAVGSPVVTMYISTAARDADLYALLEEVDAKGRSHYVSEGLLRASHRALASAPWDNLGLPWHRSFAADLQPLRPGEVVELRFDMHPVAHLFNRGHRMRITVMGADAGNTEAPPFPHAVLKLHSGDKYPSRVEFRVLAAK